ncbi:MAG TPA: methionine--tRNA ligase [Myxococcales bacterium]|nr:methionine--tRNA ligase [Myxococcales bacterium]
MASRMLVTSALPYANGSIHLGHMVEAVQTDIFVRAMNAMGKECLYICADDTHGTPIEISARKAGVDPEEYIEKMHREHVADYAAFEIGFDLFYTTHSAENELHAGRIFEKLREDGAIEKRDVLQVYCAVDQRFLPDRYIRGECPVCGWKDQYGDSCEHCGSTYEPTQLKNPRCAICGNTRLEQRTSAHYFVRLARYQEFLRGWTRTEGRLQPEIRNSIDGWLSEPLRDWDISRDAPYFGFRIPGEEEKYFYVWLDAPVGYLSSTDHWCQAHGRRVEEFWGRDADCDVVHFIGKDIVYFHTLFWPAMLHASGWKVPSRVHVHGMLMVEGAKMSKSRGTFINAREYLDAGLDPEWLRYFYAANLGPPPSDIDLSLQELKNRVNGELLANLGNLANRALSLLWKNGGRLTRLPADADFSAAAARLESSEVEPAYQRCDTRSLVQRVLEVSSSANARLQREKPWEKLKTDRDAALSELTLAANVARMCVRWLAPIVPRFAAGFAEQLGVELGWGDFAPLENREIREPRPLVRKVEDSDLQKLAARFVAAEAPPGTSSPAAAQGAAEAPKTGTVTPEMTIEQFGAMDLRAGKVLAAEKVPKKDKLLKLTIDLGEGEPRTVVSGVAQSYAPEELVGKMVCVVANLPPRTFGKGLSSHGMVLYASGGDREHTAIELPPDVKPGSKVK